VTESPAAIQPVLCQGTLPLSPDREAEQRAAVIREARTWILTPYRQLGAQRGIGVDCSMLLVRSWVDAGIFEEFDPRPYPPTWHLHKSEERYLAWMQSLATEVPAPQPGDVALYRLGRCFSHAGIVSRPGYIIHSFAKVGMCVETEMYQGRLGATPVRYFDLWEKHR
jgi:cell wall-associated NlpC family hydrolase